MKRGAAEQKDTATRPKKAAKASQGNLPAKDHFRRFAASTSGAMGSPWAFIFAVSFVLVWAMTGPFFQFSQTWQLVINTSTTIITFLMVFLIQNAQNRDVRAIHLKLDELLRGIPGSRTGLVDLEELSDDELDKLYREFQRLRAKERPNTTRK